MRSYLRRHFPRPRRLREGQGEHLTGDLIQYVNMHNTDIHFACRLFVCGMHSPKANRGAIIFRHFPEVCAIIVEEKLHG